MVTGLDNTSRSARCQKQATQTVLENGYGSVQPLAETGLADGTNS